MQNQKGIALIITVLVLSALILIVMQMSITHETHKATTENQINDLQNWYAIKSAYNIARIYLEYDAEKSKDADHLNENWAKKINMKVGKAELTIQIHDTERKINLSYLVDPKGKVVQSIKELFVRHLEYLGHSSDVADMIIDYIDPNTEGMYEAYVSNTYFTIMDEIIRVRDIPRDVLFGKKDQYEQIPGILEFVSIWPKPVGKQKIPPPVSWKININTVPKEVIMALCDEMTEELADNIISHRVSQDEEGNYRYFKKISDIKSVEGMTDEIYNKIKGLLTTKSMYFEIRAKSKIGTLIKNWVFVVCRDPVSGAIFRLTSHQLNDFFYYKPEQ